MKNCTLLAFGILMSICTYCQVSDPPAELRSYITRIHYELIGMDKAEVTYTTISPGLIKIQLTWNLKKSVSQDDWQVDIRPAFAASTHWASHLSPYPDNIVAQHLFRAPAMIAQSKDKQLIILPDLEILGKGSPAEWYMDLDGLNNTLSLGMSKSSVSAHVLYKRTGGTVYPAGKIEFGFYIMVSDKKEDLADPWRNILSFYWNKFGEPLYQAGQPLERKSMEPYVRHAYDWAFTNWKKQTWQEFDLGGKTVGGVTFIVNVTQSPDYKGDWNEREFRSVWNQAWFSSLKSASGLFRYARRSKDSVLMNYALKTKELALAFPQHNGFFAGLVGTEMGQEQGQYRSKGWNTLYFGNSNRNPYNGDPKNAPYHILDMSYTASLMLDWYKELEKDKRLLDYSKSFADALLGLQDKDGFFPAWLTLDSLKPLPVLAQSPETSMSVTFLLKLYEQTRNEKYKASALRAMAAVTDSILPQGRWEDFETYWSCNGLAADIVGKKVPRNDQYKQNTLSMYWTAEALLLSYKITREKKYLQTGQRVLDEMLMYQATWQPPYMYINTLGGFGVMNADGEWNDARQSLFAELIIDYGKTLSSQEYTHRGLAALRASFAVMYCPENPKTKIQWEKKWPFFGPLDYGFMMENYGHTGTTGGDGDGIGEFTIYDWGNGAAAEAYNRMVDHYGKTFVENN